MVVDRVACNVLIDDAIRLRVDTNLVSVTGLSSVGVAVVGCREPVCGTYSRIFAFALMLQPIWTLRKFQLVGIQMSTEKSVLSKYKRVSNGTELNRARNMTVDGDDVPIPLNLVTFIVGAKNAGKSTIISTLIAAEKANDIYRRIFYIYTDHVDSTLAETCHETLIRIPLEQSPAFITEYFKVKSEFMSWTKFLDHCYRDGLIDRSLRALNTDVSTVDRMLKSYTDNIVDAYIRNHLRTVTGKPSEGDADKLLAHACTFISKYAKEFDITVDTTTYTIDGLRYDQYDQLIIDDVGVAAPYLFPTSMNKSPLYRFMTISRHILLGTIIAGQDIQQLPRYARKEVNTFMFGIGVDIDGIAYTNITKTKQRDIMKLYPSLQQYDFIVYNGLSNAVTMFVI